MITKLVQVDELCNTLLVPEMALEYVSLVYDDAVVVNLSHLVNMPNVVEADFIVIGNEEVLHLATDTIVNIRQSPIIMNEHDVVVEYEQIDDKDAQLNDKSKEISHKARPRSLIVVIV